ncbi:MAG: sulfatase [Planctomycetota bacterium]
MTEPRRPNLLLITTDQHRPDAVGWAEEPLLAMPQLDRIAQAGCAFTDAVSICPVCQPARSCMLTGLYAHQTGLLGNSGDLSPDLPTFPRALQRAGYRTEMVGKGHWIHRKAQRPEDFRSIQARQRAAWGFDYWWEMSGKELVDHHHCDYSEDLRQAGLLEQYLAETRRIRHQGYRGHLPVHERWIPSQWPWDPELFPDHRIGQVAEERLASLAAGSQPFLLWASFVGPHPPFNPLPDRLAAEPEDDGSAAIPPDRTISTEERRGIGILRRSYRAMLRTIDERIGRLLDQLDRLGLSDDTLVVFTADHGEMLGDHGLLHKNSFYRSSVGIPLAMCGPGVQAGRRYRQPVELTDVTATLLEAAGLTPAEELAGGERLPTRSLLGANDAQPLREHAFAGNAGWRMLQTDAFKYARRRSGSADRSVLFDRQVDPAEQRNLADDPGCRDVLLDCQERLLDTLASTPAPVPCWPD